MGRLNRKAIEAEIRKTKITERQVITAGWYRIDDKMSTITAIKGLSLTPLIEKLTEEFQAAAKSFGVPLESVIIEKSGANSHLTASRLETDKEIEERVQYAVENKVSEIQRNKRWAAEEKYRKKKRIQKLQEELENLS